jgi:nitrogen fixation/metabolism regulation signal transduction histidine kinase
MYESFNEVTRRFKELNIEQEGRHQYLEALIEHVQIGLISFDKEGEVQLVNETFRNYAELNVIRNISDIQVFQPELYTQITEMRAGQDKVVRLEGEQGIVPLQVHMTEFILDDRVFYLVSVQDIRQALDSQEVESYQKLIRVLTHEIMNSVSPINSLSESLYGIVSRNEVIEGDRRENLEKGLEAIQARSKGLETFTEAYKQLTRLPKPHYEDIDVKNWVERVVHLTDKSIHLDLEDGLQVRGDAKMLDQVLINLIRNAQAAVSERDDPLIQISGSRRKFGVQLRIADNGVGIPADKLDKIFVPFFTTREEGSGIGLALSRQIIKMHGGRLDVESTAGEGTTMSIAL